MALTGHRTRSMLARQSITPAADLVDGMRRLDALSEANRHTDRYTNAPTRLSRGVNVLNKMELVTGIEPVTPSLRVTCSTS
jgi:hypothetical protein